MPNRPNNSQHFNGGANNQVPLRQPMAQRPSANQYSPTPHKGPTGGSPKKGGAATSRIKRPASFYIAIAIAAIAVVACAVLAISMASPQEPTRQRDGDLGQLEGKTPEEVQAELDRMVDEGMFNISIASVAEFPDGDSEGEIKIENVPGNRYLMQVDITRDDNGDVVYSSGIIEPNHHIQKAKLDKHLDAGVYQCTATFHALDAETEDVIGQAAAKVTINVLN